MKEKLKIFRYYLDRKYNYKFKSRDALEKFQKDKFNEHIKYVIEKSVFYREYYKGYNINNLSSLPCIDKKIMMENFDSLNTVGLNKDECFEVAFKAENSRDFSPMINGNIIGLSSGTSGNRGLFIISEEDKSKWTGTILAKALKESILRKQKVAFFLRANSNLYESVKSNHIKFEFFDLLLPLQEHVKRLNEYKPTFLVAPPSMLILLAKEIEGERLKISPKIIYSVAEILEDKDKEYLEKVFNKKIHQIYQATEGFLGITCEYGNLHLNEDFVIFEKEYIDEKRFYPIITDFERKTQPIIRYKLNDILIEKKEKCPCGSVNTCIEKVEGRSDDLFKFINKKEEEVTIFPDFIRRAIISSSEEIISYQALQESLTDVEIYIEIDEKVDMELIQENIRLSLDLLFEKYHIEKINITFRDTLVFLQGNKLRRISSKVLYIEEKLDMQNVFQ
ncbi:F390 synthetase-related protein [Clostridium sp.]|uniref:F390 synthetase-related protein n=1 Tax=Clostridium sp. TaxID=1506 RepID=UPI001DA83686|nr:F390 synthetase-related protein [Clostridium sp.]MBS5939004.1 hypothetical protein [Clostridium sp.]